MSTSHNLLIRSIERGDTDGVERAIDRGALVNSINRNGWGALHHAVVNGNDEMVNLLLAYDADPDIRSLAQGEEGATALHLAASVGHVNIMTILLKAGADPEAIDQRGKTAVHWAALQGRIDSLKLLEDYNCNLRAQVSGRGTALHYAAACGDLKVVEWLIKRGVEITSKDKNGRLAKDVAKRKGHIHVHHFLKEKSSKQFKKSVSRSKSQDAGDCSTLPVPKPRQRNFRDKKEQPSHDFMFSESINNNPSASPSSSFSRKKKWTIRSMSVGSKTGLRLQLNQMMLEMEEMEKTLRSKDVQIGRLQGDIFATELEKVSVEEQLEEMKTRLKQLENSAKFQDSAAIYTDPNTSQEKTALLNELEEVKARLVEEERARANERYNNELKIASLSAELEEASQKLKKYGVRQKKLLSKNKNFGLDLTTISAPSGLPDQGDAGALNSIIQCLYSIAVVRDYLITDAYRRSFNSPDYIVEALAGVFKALKAGIQPEIFAKIQYLKEAIANLRQSSKNSHEYNAHDLFVLVVMRLQRNFSQAARTKVMSQQFLGTEEHSLTCRWSGEDLFRVNEEFSIINIIVTSKEEVSLQNLLKDYYRPVNIEQDCPHCQRSHLCLKQINIIRLPPILIIHLNRKDTRANVTFPHSRLTLDKILRYDSPTYDLFGVITLEDKDNCQQYTAFCRNLPDSTWRLYKNERVSDVSIQKIMDQPIANILLYSAQTNL